MVFMESVLLLVVAVFDVVRPDWTYIDKVLPGAEDVCTFETPEETISCTLQPSGSCKVYSLPEYYCYKFRPECLGNKIFIKKKDFDDEFNEEDVITTLYLWNFKERRLLLTTELESMESWWKVDLPVGEHNITIRNLPGRFNESHPIKQSKFCYGCPAPRVRWIPYRTLHKFEIAVFPEEGPPNMSSVGYVDIRMFSTNETLSDCTDATIKLISVANGTMKEVLTVKDIYSINFCFRINVSFGMEPGGYQIYGPFFKQENMTVSYGPLHIRIDIPVRWIVGLVLVNVCLALASLLPCAIQRGLLRGRCLVIGSRHHRHKRNNYAHIRPVTTTTTTFIGAGGDSATDHLARPDGEENLPLQNVRNEQADSNEDQGDSGIRCQLDEISRF